MYYYLIIIVIVICLLPLYELVFTSTNYHKKKYPHFYTDITFKHCPAKYDNKINNGMNRVSNKTIVFVGMCRNVEKVINKNLNMFEELGKYFKDYRIVLFENDSTDTTRQIINNRKNNKIILLECCDMGNCGCNLGTINLYEYGATSKKRMEKMALFRNRYLNYIKKNLWHFDYCLMLDMDMEGTFNFDGFFLNFDLDEWDMICINGYMMMVGTFGNMSLTYDSLAYAKNGKDMEYCKNNSLGMMDLQKNYVKMNYLIHKSKEYMIPIKSGFNGSAIYKMKSLINSSYNGNFCCEHVGLHSNMINKGYNKIFMNKLWIGHFGKQGPFDDVNTLYKSIST